MTKEIFKIEGMDMDCPSCALNIEKGISKVPGISSCQVNFPLAQMVLDYDEEKVSLSEIEKKVSDLGYKLLMPEKPSPAKEGREILTLKVIGMNNPHCAQIVEKAVKSIKGISEVKLDFGLEKAIIYFDPALTNILVSY